MLIKKWLPLITAGFFTFIFFEFSESSQFPRKPQECPPIQYFIKVSLDPEEAMITGEEEIIWENRSPENVPDMWFHLYWNAFKNEGSLLFQEAKLERGLTSLRPRAGKWGWIEIKAIRLANGYDLKPSLQFIREDSFNSLDETVIKVTFPEPIKPKEKVHLLINFEGKIPAQGLRVGYHGRAFFIAQWYPKPGVYEAGRGWNCHPYHLNSEFFADFARFQVAITTPTGYVVGASGKEIERIIEGEKQTVIFAEDWIHDFAWTAAPDYLRYELDFIASKEITKEEIKATAHLLGIDPQELQLPDLKLTILLRPEHRHQLHRHVKALKEAIKYYGLWFGPYPYEQITLVDPPYKSGSGGMEYPTLFTAGSPLFLSREVLSPESVIIHEFGHNYWYGLIANNEFEEAWLDEGINTYCTGKVLAQAYGPGVLSFSINDLPLAWFFKLPRYFDWQLDRATFPYVVTVDPIVHPSWKFLNRISYGLNVYQRASACLYTLERLLGEGVMLRCLREFQQRFRFKHPRSEDFFQVIEDTTNLDFKWFYQNFFLSTKTFDYGIAQLRSWPKGPRLMGIFEEGGKKKEIGWPELKSALGRKKRGEKVFEEKIFVNEVVVRRYGEAFLSPDFPLKIKIVFEDNSEEIKSWFGQERWVRFLFEKPTRVRQAMVDPDGIWVIDANWANNSRSLKSDHKGIYRQAASFLFILQNFYLLLSTLI